MHMIRGLVLAVAACGLATSAWAGPPYVTDDPEPTDYGHYEIYAFAGGAATRDGSDGAGGVDFNYGAAPDLQLTMVIPLAWDSPKAGPSAANLGNIELAAKYKFLHQDDVGFDVAFFPRIFLPAGSGKVGERHVSLLLPIWIGRSWDDWSTFGGGGCTISHGGGSQNFCQLGWTLTNQVTPELQLGVEVYHQTADSHDGLASTGIGFGAVYDVSDRLHLLLSGGKGIQNADETNRYSWYTALLFTF